MLTRRELMCVVSSFYCQTVLANALPQLAEKPRLARKDCFFGLHLDLHPEAADTALGRDVSEEMITRLLERCHLDFVQYDSKGHPGYLGFPSTTGMSAPGIVQDSLAIWRRVTARHGVALYNHFSGVLDRLAVTRHPDWAQINAEGKHDPDETSLFSPYEQQLMIPELTEVALKYDLDGSWVDGDCWAVKLDYSENAAKKFRQMTGIEVLPRKPKDQGWNEFVELQRAQFRQYVALYVEALHRAKPGFQITSNWMYTTFLPEPPSVPLDYLSGDLAPDAAPVSHARVEARYLASSGKPWDLMSWGKEENHGQYSHKPLEILQHEAAITISQGGAYQLYYSPSRAGLVGDDIIDRTAAVGAFCRERQRWSHHSESIPEVGVLFSGRTLYRQGNRPFGPWGSAEGPIEGAIDLLLANGYSVDVVPDYKAAEVVALYPMMMIPDWADLGFEMIEALVRYVHGGGKLLLCGAANAQLFASALNLQVGGAASERSYALADGDASTRMHGNWLEVHAPESDVLLKAYSLGGSKPDTLPMAVRLSLGKGTVIVCPGPLASAYRAQKTTAFEVAAGRLARELRQPMVKFDGYSSTLEVVLRRMEGQTSIHLIRNPAAIAGASAETQGKPPAGLLRLQIRLARAPLKVILEPGGTLLSGVYRSGMWHGSIPDPQLHSILRVVTEV